MMLITRAQRALHIVKALGSVSISRSLSFSLSAVLLLTALTFGSTNDAGLQYIILAT